MASTKEAAEPNHAGHAGGKSVWYRWTAPATRAVTIDTVGSAFDTLLAVYTGAAVNTLSIVASNDELGSGSHQSRVTFMAMAGTVYRIAVDGFLGAEGAVTLHLSSATAPANDSFAAATAIAGLPAAVSGTNVAATKEAAEPNHAGHAGGTSVWYHWTAPKTASVTIDTVGSAFDTLLAVYTGAAVGTLTLVAAGDDLGASSQHSRVTFMAIAGTVYRIAIDGKAGATGASKLTLSIPPPPANDMFAAAALLPAVGEVSGTNVGATRETGEPLHAGTSGGASIWYRWTAPAAGAFTFATSGASFNTILAVYTGNAVNALTTIARNGPTLPSSVTFVVTQGTTYRIAVDGFNGAVGSVTLRSSLAAPPNDLFTNASVLSGAFGDAVATTVRATKQPGEPNHSGVAGGRSVWFFWTAPKTGTVQFDTSGSAVDTVLAVYSGTQVSALTLKASNNDSGASKQSLVTVPVTIGLVYRIAVDAVGAAQGAIRLHWQ